MRLEQARAVQQAGTLDTETPPNKHTHKVKNKKLEYAQNTREPTVLLLTSAKVIRSSQPALG